MTGSLQFHGSKKRIVEAVSVLTNVRLTTPTNDSDTLKSAVVLTGDNLTATISNPSSLAIATEGISSGKAYYEMTINTLYPEVGICTANPTQKSNRLEASTTALGLYIHPAALNCTYTGCGYGGGTGFNAGDTLGVAIDADNNIIKWYRIVGTTRTLIGTTTTANSGLAAIPKPWHPCIGVGSGTIQVKANFGGSPFIVDPPEDYLKYSTDVEDYEPNLFTFSPVSANINTYGISADVTLSGFNQQIPISIVNGEYSIKHNGVWGNWLSTPSTVVSTDVIKVRNMASGVINGENISTLTVGSYSTDFKTTAIVIRGHLSLVAHNPTAVVNQGLVFDTAYSSDGGGRGDTGISSGKMFWEVKAGQAGGAAMVGVIKDTSTQFAGTNIAWYITDKAVGFYIIGGDPNQNYGSIAGATINNPSFGTPISFANGVVLGFALDMDAKTLSIYRNGVFFAVAMTGLSGTIYPYYVLAGAALQFNFGNNGYWHGAPAGY